jgi:PleD family two-component response regulator
MSIAANVPGHRPAFRLATLPLVDLVETERRGREGAGRAVRVLLVEDDPLFASLIRSALTESRPNFEIETVSRLSSALAWLVREPTDLILADLDLPDSQGTGTVRFFKRAAPNLPLIVLSGSDDMELALEAVREGAEEYVAKGSFSVHSLVWLVLLVLERHRRVMDELAPGNEDPLSGLTNLPALEVFGRYLLRLADRTGLSLGLLFFRMEAPPRGRWADWEALLVEVSGVLHRTLRRCDVLSRVGRHELAAVLVSQGPNLAGALARVQAAIAAAGIAPYVQVGLAIHLPSDAETLDDLLAGARSCAVPVPA